MAEPGVPDHSSLIGASSAQSQQSMEDSALSFGVGGEIPGGFRGCCWLYTQELILVVLRISYGMLGIKLRSALCQANQLLPLNVEGSGSQKDTRGNRHREELELKK